MTPKTCKSNQLLTVNLEKHEKNIFFDENFSDFPQFLQRFTKCKSSRACVHNLVCHNSNLWTGSDIGCQNAVKTRPQILQLHFKIFSIVIHLSRTMESIQTYESSSEENIELEDERKAFELLAERQVRSVYLLAYSQVNLTMFPTRESFANAVLEAFSKSTTTDVNGMKQTTVVQWVCSKEDHQSGYCYLMTVKLNKVKRWLKARKFLTKSHQINVDFSSSHFNYYSAYSYTCKEDKNALHSPGHPDLINCKPPRTMKASILRAKRLDSESETGESDCEDKPQYKENKPKPRKRTRLTAFDVSQIAVFKGIKNHTKLLTLASIEK